MSTRHPLDYYLNLEYPFTVVPDDGSFFIEFPDLKGCVTQVEDASEIGPMAEEIRTLWLETVYEQGVPIPEPAIESQYSGKFVVRLPKKLHRDLALAAERESTSLNSYVTYVLANRYGDNQILERLTQMEELVRQLKDGSVHSADDSNEGDILKRARFLVERAAQLRESGRQTKV